jgi:hypothetical protein
MVKKTTQPVYTKTPKKVVTTPAENLKEADSDSRPAAKKHLTGTPHTPAQAVALSTEAWDEVATYDTHGTFRRVLKPELSALKKAFTKVPEENLMNVLNHVRALEKAAEKNLLEKSPLHQHSQTQSRGYRLRDLIIAALTDKEGYAKKPNKQERDWKEIKTP